MVFEIQRYLDLGSIYSLAGTLVSVVNLNWIPGCGSSSKAAVNITNYSVVHDNSSINLCSVSSLAWFMSNQENSFVTIGQRLLANPLR